MGVFVIAEAGSSHDVNLFKALRLVEAAKECGADAVKFQWTSNPEAMAARRGHPEWAAGYKKYLAYPFSWLNDIKRRCDQLQIEFMVTVYLIEDIATIVPLVSRFKVSAFESTWAEFIQAHTGKPIVISINNGKFDTSILPMDCPRVDYMHCVSEYPTPIERVGIKRAGYHGGLSDHTTSTLTGALAVAAGATIVEKHIRLPDTALSNPDFKHSLVAHATFAGTDEFRIYVANIREAEKAL
jgi:sialic acid synthase SpsE